MSRLIAENPKNGHFSAENGPKIFIKCQKSNFYGLILCTHAWWVPSSLGCAYSLKSRKWLPVPWGPDKSYLGIRMILILPQDVANMFVHMFSSKLEQLKAIIIRSIKRSWQNRWRRWAQIHKQGSEAEESCWSAPPVELCWSSSPRQSLLLSKVQTVKEVFHWRWNRPQSESS